jgi:hypothetical protein
VPGEYGTVFALTPNAAKTAWTETVLYSFCALYSCTDGYGPFASLIMDGAGGFVKFTFREPATVVS